MYISISMWRDIRYIKKSLNSEKAFEVRVFYLTRSYAYYWFEFLMTIKKQKSSHYSSFKYLIVLYPPR